MSQKNYFLLAILALSTLVQAAEPVKFKLYGFVRTEAFYNSRENTQAMDGLLNLIPKPIQNNPAGDDINGNPQLEMLSVATRLGVDMSGTEFLGAKASAKIEADFSGVGTTYFLFNLRQANVKLNWENTELLVGQTWHPLFGNVLPTHNSLNIGAPFQPFNRSPQIRVKQNITSGLSLTGAAIYQMQFLSQGPNGASAVYQKQAMLPNLNLTAEYKTTHWLSGAGLDFKVIRPQYNERLASTSFVAFSQYSDNMLQLKAKAILGQNLTDHLMIGGYGVSAINSGVAEYTNLNTFTTWFNAEYGKKWQVGIFAGLSKNLGSDKTLFQIPVINNVIMYGNGFYNTSQEMTDQLWRVVPHINYSYSNIKIGLEYELTNAMFGRVQANGKVANPYDVNNHRVMAMISYNF